VRVEAGGVQLTFKDLETPRIYRGHVNEDILLVLNMAIHRSALMAVGGFDERLGPGTAFPGAEDNDLGLRLLEAGYAIRYVPEAVVIHRAWRPTEEYLTLRWSYGVAQGAFYAKHCRLRDGYMAGRMYGDVARHLRRFPARLRWRDRAGLAHDLVYTSGLLYGAARWRLTYGTAIASVAHI
jgi:GT2 family glycosyltransferase